MRSRYPRAAATSVTGGTRFGMTIARANWRAVHGNTACSIAPSRKWTCQSSGRRIVIVSGVGGIGDILIGALLNKTRLGTGQPDALVGLLDHLLECVCRWAGQGAAGAVAADNSQPQLQLAGAGRGGLQHFRIYGRRDPVFGIDSRKARSTSGRRGDDDAYRSRLAICAGRTIARPGAAEPPAFDGRCGVVGGAARPGRRT